MKGKANITLLVLIGVFLLIYFWNGRPIRLDLDLGEVTGSYPPQCVTK